VTMRYTNRQPLPFYSTIRVHYENITIICKDLLSTQYQINIMQIILHLLSYSTENEMAFYLLTSCKYSSSGRRFIALRALLSRPCGPLSAVFITLRARILSALAGLCKELAFTRWHQIFIVLRARILSALAGLCKEFY